MALSSTEMEYWLGTFTDGERHAVQSSGDDSSARERLRANGLTEDDINALFVSAGIRLVDGVIVPSDGLSLSGVSMPPGTSSTSTDTSSGASTGRRPHGGSGGHAPKTGSGTAKLREK